MNNQKGRSLLFWLVLLSAVIVGLVWLARDHGPDWLKRVYPPAKFLEIYFVKDNGLAAVRRPWEKSSDGTAALKTALEFLLTGPNAAEKRRGFGSEIAPQAVLRRVWVAEGLANLDFPASFADNGGGAGRIETGLAQIVFTATALPGIKAARFWLDGRSGEIVLGSEGYVIDHPLTQQDFDIPVIK